MRWIGCLILAMLGAMPAHATVTVSLSSNYLQLVLGAEQQFHAKVGGTSNSKVVWEVDNVRGGTSASGTITSGGLYNPPATMPVPAIATITAISQADPSASATATVTLLGSAPGGTTFYVAATGDDGNPGTKAEQWKTIQHAADEAKAGDTVLVRGGVYTEHVEITSAGSANRGYITFESYPDEKPIVDGTGLDIPGGQFGLFTLNNAAYVIISGFEVRNYTTASVRQVPIGIYIEGAGRNDQLINNSVHDITTTAKTTPNACASNAFGITVYGTKAPQPIEGLGVSGNPVFDNKTGCSETLSLDGNVTNFAVVSNVVHDDNNIAVGAIGFEKVSPDVKYDQARNGVIRGNTIYNITSYGNPDYGKQYASDGIYIDGGENIVIEQNLIHNADLGIELASEHKTRVTSGVIARNNVIYGGNSAGISIGGYGSGRGGTHECKIVNNTLYNNDTKKTGSGEFQIQYNATNNIFENNIVYAGPQALMVNDFTGSTASPASLDHNLYFSLKGANKSVWVWQKKSHAGYANYQRASKQDAHSPAFANPQFLGVSTPPNLDIANASPAWSIGAVLGADVTGAVDFGGNPRVQNGGINLGAYEQ
jgi:hypothetical protein